MQDTNHKRVAINTGLRLKVFNREKICSCGHPVKYHIQGNSKCLFGVCNCDHYKN